MEDVQLADGAINLLQERRNIVLGDEPGVNGEKRL